jgi:serine/threonine-protein kinase RsbW
MMRCDAQYYWCRLDISSRPENAAVVRRAVERIAIEAGLTPAETDDLDLAVTEACANAIRHGSPEKERSTVRVTFFLAPECVLVEVHDQGPGFTEGSRRAPAAGELRDGGYGLHIMRQLMDDVEIIWHRGTTVRLVKQRVPERAPSVSGAAAEPIPAFA